MRFSELRLTRFGSFHDERLIFRPARALHVVYGDNEAGKSTALRAIRALLFGIPRGTTDAHRFKPGELSIGATLETESGSLVFERRRGKVGLFGANGEPMEEAQLAAELEGVDAETHELMFSLDHQSLREGGEALLEGRGDAARALFQAHTGHGRFLRVVERLAAERDEIFTELGRKKPLNTAIKAYFEAERAMHEQELSPDTYESQLEAIRQCREERERLRQRREELELERSRCAVVVRVRSLVAERARARSEREKLPFELGADVPFTLPQIEAWQAAAAVKKRAGEEIERLRAIVSDAERELAGLRYSKQLVAAKPKMSALERRLGATREIALREQALLGELRSADAQLSALHARAPREFVERDEQGLARGLAACEALRDSRQGVREMSSRLAAAEVLRDRSARALETVEKELAALTTDRKTDTADASSDAALRSHTEKLASEAQEGRGLERAIARRESDRREALRLEHDLGVSDPKTVFLPEAAAVSSWKKSLTRLSDERRRLDAEGVALERREVAAEATLARLRSEGEVPQEGDLAKLRRTRDESIEEIARKPAALATAKKAVSAADELADRLRRERERVAEFARASTERDAARAERIVVERGLADANAKREAIAAIVVAKAPWLRSALESEEAELEGPVASMRRYADLKGAEAEQAAESGALAARIITRVQAITRALGDRGSEQIPMPVLGEALERADAILPRAVAEVEGRTEKKVRRARLEEAHTRAAAEHAALAADVERLSADRDRAAKAVARRISEVTFIAPGSDDEVIDLVTAHARDVLAVEREATRLRAERGLLVETLAEFQREVTALARELVIEEIPGDAFATAEAALAAFTRDAEREARATKVGSAVASAASDLARYEDEARQADEARLEIMRSAGLERLDEAERVALACARAHELEAEVVALEEKISSLGDGRSVVELVDLARSFVDIDVPARTVRVEEELEETDARMSTLDQSIGRQEAGLPSFLVSNALAGATRAEAELEKVRDLTLSFARKHVFNVVVRGAIEKFRTSRAERIVARAGELALELTGGSLIGFTTTSDDDDVSRLAAVRHDGRAAAMTELSDGTRDAVFFALRVACLESLAEARALPPVVLDDALVHFDDDRARAALRILARLANHTQVLFFTHHARLVELASEVAAGEALVIHRLERRVAAALATLS